MVKFSSKKKIYVFGVLWLGLCVLMPARFFKILDGQNQASLGRISEQRREVWLLEAEQDSFNKAKQDLQALAAQEYQAENFFTQEPKFVNELRVLESLGKQFGVIMETSGFSGILRNAQKAKTRNEIFVLPYSLTVQGPFEKVMALLEVLENLDFVNHVSAVNLSAAAGDSVSLSMAVSLYLRK